MIEIYSLCMRNVFNEVNLDFKVEFFIQIGYDIFFRMRYARDRGEMREQGTRYDL